jgi:hypothetical protein
MNKKISILPMRIHIPDEDIDSLHRRLEQTRWPVPVAGSDWVDGTDGEYLRDLAGYWLSKYNWREREATLNCFDHFTAEIEDAQIHFIRAGGEGPNPIPLILMQGWPSSFVQMQKIIPLLTGQQRKCSSGTRRKLPMPACNPSARKHQPPRRSAGIGCRSYKCSPLK